MSGGAALGAAFFLPAVAEVSGRQLLVTILGTLQAVFATGILALVHCAGRGGRELLDDALASKGALLETRFVWLSAALGVSGGLVAAGVLLGSRARRPLAYRLVELAGIGLFFFVLTILSLCETDDVVYPSLVLVGGTALLAVGVLKERLILVAGAVVVSQHASELVHPLTIAVEQRLTVDELAATFTVYPSLSGSIAEAARRLHIAAE